jgi:hypothetical protein
MLLNAYAENMDLQPCLNRVKREIIAVKQLEIHHLRSVDVDINEVKH